MNFKVVMLIVAGVVALAISGVAVYFVRQAGEETAASHRGLQVEAACGEQVPKAIRLVTGTDSPSGEPTRVTASTYHYNHALQSCFVEVSTRQQGEPPINGKMLISMSQNSAVLWSVAEEIDAPTRRCFGQDAKPMPCNQADQRWKIFMTE